MNNKILVIEDDKDIAGLLEIHLKDINLSAELVSDGLIGLEKALSKKHALIVLDLVLPGVDGLEICKDLRSRKIDTPILMLTSKSSVMDRVLGLEIGADDYLTKPFSVREFQARVKALLRRKDFNVHSDDNSQNQILNYNDMFIDISKRKVTIHNKDIILTAKEFDLLLQFARNPGRVYSRTELLDVVWGYNFHGYEHTVNSHINRLRSKIESDPHSPEYILTVHRMGYKFAELKEQESVSHV